MRDLIKSGELSSRYGVSTRTLRYYEEMGIIESRRTDEYAYRLYDEAAVKRLEQILILRKLNINIKDIQRVFAAAGSDVVLDVLSKKVNDIDEEVALLHELKEIVLDFIRQIERADFGNQSDVKLLYEKAKEIETQITEKDYIGNPSPVHRLFDVTEKLEGKGASRLSVSVNVLKRMLRNVYFVLGDGVAVADELNKRYGIYVYHTCNYRQVHKQNSDPRYQPGLCRFVENAPDFYSLDPEAAMQLEGDIVHDFTPMVIMDLIQLTATHDKVICENDIDIDSIIPFITHAVRITDRNLPEGWFVRYESEIRGRDISETEKVRLISTLRPAFWKVKGKNPDETAQYGVKEILLDENSTVEQTADIVAEYFGLSVQKEG